MSAQSKAPNRTCITCGASYYFCNCHHNADKYQWKMNCCTPLHFQIFITALDLRDGIIDEKEAKARLNNLGFKKSDLAWCTPSITDILSPVFKTRKKEQEVVEEGE